MPPKRKAPAKKKASTSEPSREVLQPIPTNSRKRSFAHDAKEDESQPKTKRSSTSSTRKSDLEAKWDVTGHYNLTCVNRFRPVKTKGYALTIYHVSDQLFALFHFDKLNGVMRICPLEAFNKRDEDGDGLFLEDFEEACDLEDGCKPGPKNDKWIIRWRGHDENNHVLTIAFGMVHQGKHLIFHCSKSRNLEDGAKEGKLLVGLPWKLWYKFCDPQWEVETESDVESDGSIPRKPKDHPKGGLIRAKNKPGPNPGYMPNSLVYEAAQAASTATPTVATPLPSWNGTGKYSVTRASKGGMNIATFSLRIFYCGQNLPHHMWATFSFDKLEGLMQFCPRYNSESDIELAELEEECDIKEEMVPGPEHPKWLMRWRGRDGSVQLNKDTGGNCKDIGEFNFEKDTEQLSTGFTGVKITFFMWLHGDLFRFDASKVADLDESEKAYSAWSLRRKWHSLDHPGWYKPTSRWLQAGSPTGAKRGKKPAPAHTVAGPSALPLESPPDWAWDVSGEWIITSDMLREAMGVGIPRDDRFSHLDPQYPTPPAEMSMKIILANNSRHNRIGRQLWAVFRFGGRHWGEGFRGVMRFNPESNHGEHTCTLKGFEKSCVLKPGVWPGPSPQGEAKWKFRWRGMDDNNVLDKTGDQATSSMTFKAGADGKLSLEGVLVHNYLMIPNYGVKTTTPIMDSRSGGYHSREKSVTQEWLMYQRRPSRLI